MFIDYSVEPIDIISENNGWLCTYRYEPFLKKWFYIEPTMKGEVRLINTDDVPQRILIGAKKMNIVN